PPPLNFSRRGRPRTSWQIRLFHRRGKTICRKTCFYLQGSLFPVQAALLLETIRCDHVLEPLLLSLPFQSFFYLFFRHVASVIVFERTYNHKCDGARQAAVQCQVPIGVVCLVDKSETGNEEPDAHQERNDGTVWHMTDAQRFGGRNFSVSFHLFNP